MSPNVSRSKLAMAIREAKLSKRWYIRSARPNSRRSRIRPATQTPTTVQQTNDDEHLAPVDEAAIHGLTRPDDKLLTLYLIYALATTLFFPIAIIPLYFRFRTLRYRFDAEGVAVSYGILWRKETYLTYARIQDIHVTRNIFERWLGLGTVEIQTASGSTSAAESIVGVTQFDAIRNYLYGHMRGHARLDRSDPDALPVASTESTLAAIRDELRAVRLILEERNDV